jgi:SAM-dependent methyltransferase
MLLTPVTQRLLEADRSAIKNHGVIPEEMQRRTVADFARFTHTFNATVGQDAPLPADQKVRLGKAVQRALLQYVALTRTADRFYAKPRGYAGDFLTIAQIYDNDPAGFGRIGALIDRCFLNEPAARAVRNRRALLRRIIEETVAECDGSPAYVLSLACGPAQELFDIFETLPDSRLVRARLVDIDWQALAFVADKREKMGLRRQMHLYNRNLIRLASGRETLVMPPQHFIYSIGLIDYFKDEIVLRLIDTAYDWLAPGGRLVLGNFHPDNSTRALMDHVLEWRLIHRTEADMHRLFAASKFGKRADRIEYEACGINLFAHGVKA